MDNIQEDDLLRRRMALIDKEWNEHLVPKDWTEEMEWKQEKPCQIDVCVCGPVFVFNPATKLWSQVFSF